MLNQFRLKFSNKLIWYLLKNKVDNIIILRFFLLIVNLLTNGYYKFDHKKSNHHFVPQFLLRYFRIAPNKGMVYEYSETNPHGKARSIRKHICISPNLYTFTEKNTKRQSDFIEDQMFSNLIEQFSPTIIDQILTPGFRITSLEESIISTFVGFQYTRTPKFLYQTNKYLTYLLKTKAVSLDEIAGQKNINTFFNKAFVNNAYGITIQDLNNFQINNNETLSGAENLILTLSILAGNYLAEQLQKTKQMTMVIDHSHTTFITDHPVMIYQPNDLIFMGPLLWSLGSMIVIMPLTPSRLIFYHNSDHSFPGLELARKAAMVNGTGNIYASKQDAYLYDLYREYLKLKKESANER